MLKFSSFPCLIPVFVLFPYFKAATWLSRFADVQFLYDGLFMIAFGVTAGLVENPLENTDEFPYAPVGAIASSMGGFVNTFGWLVLVAGVIMAIYSFFQTKQEHKSRGRGKIRRLA